MNEESRRLYKFFKEQMWAFMNRDIKGDEEGKWTYAGEKKESVIDVIGDEKRRSMVVEEKLESVHNPIIVNIKGKEKRRRAEAKKKEKSKWGKLDGRKEKRI